MSFAHLVGNDLVKQQLNTMAERDRIGQALLFAGPEGVGKQRFAFALSARLLGEENLTNHPDLLVLRTEGKAGLHTIDALRAVGDACQQTPYRGRRRIFLIDNAERMLPTATNALLKSFEEPLPSSLIILVTAHPERLLDTVVSRCRRLFFRPIDRGLLAEHLMRVVKIEPSRAAAIAAQADGSMAKALLLVEGEWQQRRQLVVKLLWNALHRNDCELRQLVDQLVKGLETEDALYEEKLRSEMLPEQSSEWSAVQREQIEKEVAGLTALHQSKQLDFVLETLLSLCRDLHALLYGDARVMLNNPDYQTSLWQAIQRATPPPLEKILSAVEQARLARQRSIPLAATLEVLFLTIQEE